MLICIFDTETTGLDVNECKIIDLAAVWYDTELKKPIRFFSELIKCDEELITDTISELTGISKEMIKKYGTPKNTIFNAFYNFLSPCDYMLAHNYFVFDGPVLKNNFKTAGLELPSVKALDSLLDIDFPKNIKIKQLDYLSYKHNYIMSVAHRAIYDVLALTHIVSQYDFDSIIKKSEEPEYMFIGQEPEVTYMNKDKTVKPFGFYWDSEMKYWYKRVKESEKSELLSLLQFNPKLVPIVRERN